MKDNLYNRIMQYMKAHGKITSLSAIYDLGCLNLPSRISEMRKKGYKIASRKVKALNRYGEQTTFNEYFIKED